MKDILIFAAVLVVWIVLNVWVLPWFGIRTCMSGACSRVPAHPAATAANPGDRTPSGLTDGDASPGRNDRAGRPEP